MTVSIAYVESFFLALTRILAIFMTAPILSNRLIPTQVKVGLGVLLTAILLPFQAEVGPADPLGVFLLNIGRELVTGMLVGFAGQLVFAAFQIMGDMIGLTAGLQAAYLLNPTLGTSGTALESFYALLAALLFLTLDGHHQVILALQRTFEIVPLRTLDLTVLQPERLIALSAHMLAAALQMALPVLGAVLVADVAMALMARVVPQMNVFFVGAPLKLGLALAALMLGFPLILPLMRTVMAQIGPEMVRVLH